MIQIYKKYCQNCKKTTFWKILQTNRSRGIKLICLGCMVSGWFNYNKIKKYEFKTQINHAKVGGKL